MCFLRIALATRAVPPISASEGLTLWGAGPFFFRPLVARSLRGCRSQRGISKLWLQRIADRRTVFNWDRGADVAAVDAQARAIVDFLAAGLAEHVFVQ